MITPKFAFVRLLLSEKLETLDAEALELEERVGENVTTLRWEAKMSNKALYGEKVGI